MTVDYERARGRRAKHERPDGFAVSKSRTLPAPVSAVYRAWVDDEARGAWLGTQLAISSTQPDRTVRGRWDGGPSRVAVYLSAKAASRTQVQVQHEKLPDAAAAEQAKADWAQRLERLARTLADR